MFLPFLLLSYFVDGRVSIGEVNLYVICICVCMYEKGNSIYSSHGEGDTGLNIIPLLL